MTSRTSGIALRTRSTTDDEEADVLLEGDAAHRQHNRSSGRDAVTGAKARAVPAREPCDVETGRDHLRLGPHAVAVQHVRHLRRRRDDGVDRIALPPGDRAARPRSNARGAQGK